MNDVITLPNTTWDQRLSAAEQELAVDALERGNVMLFPQLSFLIQDGERQFLSPTVAGEGKNVSLEPSNGSLRGSSVNEPDLKRLAYDHYMLHLHDRMKADMEYQSQVTQRSYEFNAGSTWMVFTDLVSHAVTGGQYAFEQTYHLPVNSMRDPSRAPLRILEKLLGHELV